MRSRLASSLSMWLAVLLGFSFGLGLAWDAAAEMPVRFQLNWFHDPTFAAVYRLQSDEPGLLRVLEGGPAVFPLGKLRTGEAQVAIVGLDVLLRAVSDDLANDRSTPFRILGIDFQRSPVVYVLHPAVAASLGLTESSWQTLSPTERNDWLFHQVANNRIRIGDKVDTETTAVWEAWRSIRGLSSSVRVVAVGFDPQIVLEKPPLAYPVYLNEEPFKLEQQIGHPPLVFDPAADGVHICGNALVTSVAALSASSGRITELRRHYYSAWKLVRSRPRKLLIWC